MLTCLQCGETSSFLANYCRRCGSALRLVDPDATSILTQPIDVRFFPSTGQRVTPLEDQFCTIKLSIEVHTLSHVSDISNFAMYDDEAKQKIIEILNYRKPFDFGLIPVDKISEALKTLGEEFSNRRVYPPTPHIFQSRWIDDEIAFQGFYFNASFSLSFRYNLTSFYDDRKLVLQKITDAIKDLYDWTGFKIIAKCSFGIDTQLTL